MRVTEKMLEAKIAIINSLTGSPADYATRHADGTVTTNPGHFHLSHAYGGVSLHRTMNDAGGVTDVFSCGHVPKRELCYRIEAYLDALQDVRMGEVELKK